MEMIYSRELGLNITECPPKTTNIDYSLSDALTRYQRLKGNGKTKLFCDVSNRSVRYLTDYLAHNNLIALETADAGQFRDYLFARGMSSPSVEKVFISANYSQFGNPRKRSSNEQCF